MIGRPALVPVILALWLPAAAAAAAALPAVKAPPGFSVKQIPKDGSYSAEWEIDSDSDPDFGCQVGFDPSKAMPGVSQDRINAATGGSDYIAVANASVAPHFDVEGTEPFAMQGVKGFAMTGVPKGGAGEVRSLLFLFQTPPGRTVVSCGSPPARFDVLRPTFERIVRGVALPR